MGKFLFPHLSVDRTKHFRALNEGVVSHENECPNVCTFGVQC